MKAWTSPEISELDVRLTEKGPGVTEQMAHWGFGGWQTATYNVAVGDVSIPQNSRPGLS